MSTVTGHFRSSAGSDIVEVFGKFGSALTRDARARSSARPSVCSSVGARRVLGAYTERPLQRLRRCHVVQVSLLIFLFASVAD